jgi:hypothetical protein
MAYAVVQLYEQIADVTLPMCCTGCHSIVLCAALALFNTISHPFHVFPKAIQLWASSKVAMDRITSFLLEKVILCTLFAIHVPKLLLLLLLYQVHVRVISCASI